MENILDSTPWDTNALVNNACYVELLEGENMCNFNTIPQGGSVYQLQHLDDIWPRITIWERSTSFQTSSLES